MTFYSFCEDQAMILRGNMLQRLLEDMKELWEYFKQSCRFINRLLLFSLSVLAVFQSSSAAVSGLYDNDLIMISNCSSVPQTNCPTAKELVAFREQCINDFERDSCPDGTSYLCGVVPGYFIETCAEDKECWPGTYFSFVLRNGTATVECVRCPDGAFETEYTKTSQSSHVLGCTYRHIPQDDISSNLVLYENGTHATRSIYRCKTEEGFYDEYGNKFCDDIPSHRCKCIFKYCEPGHQLHPTGHCRRCRKKLRPEKDWRCEDYFSYQTTSTKNYLNGKSTTSGASSSDSSARSSHLSSSARTNTNQDVSTVTDPSRGISLSSTDSVLTDSDMPTLIVGVLSGAAIVALFCFLVFLLFQNYKKRSKTVRHKNPISPAVTVHDKSVTKIEVTHVYSYDGNVQLGERSKMINTVTTPVKDGPPLKKEDIDDALETLPDHLKLHTLETTQLLQDSDSADDNDRDQTAKKTRIL